jgi:hypothetical protein
MLTTIFKKFLQVIFLFVFDSIFILFFHQNYFSLLGISFFNKLEAKNADFNDIGINLMFLLIYLMLFYYDNIMMLLVPFYFMLIYKYIQKYIVYTKYRYLIIKLIGYVLFLLLIGINLRNSNVCLLNIILFLLF